VTFTKYDGNSAVWKYFELNFVTREWGWEWGDVCPQSPCSSLP